MKEPAFRATWTKFAIQGINRSARRDAVRAAIGDETLAQLRQCSVVDWLPVATHLRVAGAVHEVFGIAGARQFWKERLLVGAGIVFGEQPYALMKIAMTSYRLMAKNAGSISVASQAGAVIMTFQDMAPAMAESAGWHALCHGQCEAVLEYLKMRGEIKLTDVKPQSFRYIMRKK